MSISALLLGGAYLGILQLTGNFHEAIPGVLYRSAQVDPGDLTRYRQQYGIRSVINLRGENAGRAWYDRELSEAQQLGLHHYDFRMSAEHELNHDRAVALIALMRDAPKPLLIHCQAGADRTGLASALYLAAIQKSSEWAAERQLWLIYGHLPLYFNSAFAMNRTFEALEPWLGFPDS